MNDNPVTIQHVAYHRNGVGGAPFVAAIIESEGARCLAIDFSWVDTDGELQDKFHFAVLDLDMAAAGNIYMSQQEDANGLVEGTGGNAWRGDQLAGAWRKAIQSACEAQSDEQLNFTIARMKREDEIVDALNTNPWEAK